MLERDDSLSLHENDSRIEFPDQVPKYEQLYHEIDVIWAEMTLSYFMRMILKWKLQIKHRSRNNYMTKSYNPYTLKRTLLFNRQTDRMCSANLCILWKRQKSSFLSDRGFIRKWTTFRWWGGKGSLFHFHRTLVASDVRGKRISIDLSSKFWWRRIWETYNIRNLIIKTAKMELLSKPSPHITV